VSVKVGVASGPSTLLAMRGTETGAKPSRIAYTVAVERWYGGVVVRWCGGVVVWWCGGDLRRVKRILEFVSVRFNGEV
jgi:hypothetical protein